MRAAALLLVASCVAGVPAPAAAQPSRFSVRGAVAAGSMVSRDQLGWLGFDSVALSGSAAVSYAILPSLDVELRFAGAYFLSQGASAGALAEGGGGVRVSLPVSSWARVEASAHLSAGWTGPLLRPTADVGLGAAFALTPELWAGPQVVYGHVFWTDGGGYSTDAGFLTVGLAVAWRPIAEPSRERVRTVERTRVERVVEREVVVEPALPEPAERVELDRLLDDALPVTHREEVVLIPPVLFDFDSAQVTAGGEVALFSARDLIAEMPDDIVIEGHADGTGTDEYNAELSLARATRVRDWLVDHGIEAGRLTVEPHGESRHLTEETDDWTRQLSRRVTFRAVRVTDDAGEP